MFVKLAKQRPIYNIGNKYVNTSSTSKYSQTSFFFGNRRDMSQWNKFKKIVAFQF